MTDPPIIRLYETLVNTANSLGLNVYSQAQDIENLPACRISLLSGDNVNQLKNVRQYSYPFQFDVVTDKDELTLGLTYAYQLMKMLGQVEVAGCAISFADNGTPSLTSTVDTSTNRTLNRQIIRTTYQIIESAVL